MSNNAKTADDERRKWSTGAIVAALLLLLLFGVIAFGTVRGCFVSSSEQAADDDEKKKQEELEKQRKIPDFKLDPPVVLPSEPKVAIPPVKPGHWASASQEMRSNMRDFVGDSLLSTVDNQNRPYSVESTPYFLRSSRPVLLTKGRPKATETTFFVPQVNKTVNIAMDLEERGLGSGPPQARTGLTMMPTYQYHLVILAKSPSRYSFIKTLDSVSVPFQGESENERDTLQYLVVELGADQVTSLPDNPLTWTSIAYLFWDDIDPGEPFPADQKKALVDWLHWGGQLIISGPDSLDTLKGSFLDPYLPATNDGAKKFEPDDKDLAELNSGWIISTLAMPGKPIQVTAPWSGIKLKLRPGATVLPNTGGLFVERPVGRGRVVVSAIRLPERDFINWRSGFESFFNACLLRRPPRKYSLGFYEGLSLNWADERMKERRLDASLNTRLYYYARDLGVTTAYHFEETPDPDAPPPVTIPSPGGRPLRTLPGGQQMIREYRPPDNSGGVGAWNDYSAAASAAREALREAAGVEVPDAGFVVLCLAAYLIALVPLNWLIFRTAGRVEWAWVAAPFIAIAGTWVIVQRARLDIGFVRSQTEIGFLEQQPDHARAHLSRYTALYTSLSTTYDFDFGNMTTLIAPFPTHTSAADFQLLGGEGLTPINFQRYDNVRLAGLPISSNSTGMVHSEQMLPLDGPIRIGQSVAKRDQIENRSALDLHSVCVIKRKGANLEGRWIGDLLPGQSIPLTAARLPANKVPFADDRAAEARTKPSTRLNLEPMFLLAVDPRNIADGEMRLVGRVDEVLAGETITPAASQVRGATLVVAHLQYAPIPPPSKDANTRQEIKAKANQAEAPGAVEL